MQRIINLLSFLAICLLVACSSGQANNAADSNSTTTDAVAETTNNKATKQGLQIGDIAPDFELEGIDGELHSLATIKAANGASPKGYIVTFTCNTCPYAIGYEERLAALHEELAPMGYPIVAIQPNDTSLKPDDDLPSMKQRAAEKNFGFAYLLDKAQTVFPAYGATKTPEIYLLDAKRVLRYHGAIDDSAQDPAAVTVNYVKKAVAALEAGAEPDPQEVKAIGCSIKVK